jgi:2-dehydro-3-deoxyglucarate aldolase
VTGETTHLKVAAALKKKFRSRDRLFGAWLSIGSAEIASIFAASRGDFVGIDLEHTTIPLATAQSIIRACHEYGRPCLPRVYPGNVEDMRRLLDGGADGIIIPQVSAPEQILMFQDNMKYPPDGSRGFGVAAAQLYGRGFHEYVLDANSSLSLIIQIETVTGVENIDRILAISAIDGVMVGPYDLSGSLGVPGKLDAPIVVEACERVVDACARRAISCGMHLVYPSAGQMRQHFEKNFTFLILGSDIFNLWKRSEETDGMIEELGEGT